MSRQQNAWVLSFHPVSVSLLSSLTQAESQLQIDRLTLRVQYVLCVWKRETASGLLSVYCVSTHTDNYIASRFGLLLLRKIMHVYSLCVCVCLRGGLRAAYLSKKWCRIPRVWQMSQIDQSSSRIIMYYCNITTTWDIMCVYLCVVIALLSTTHYYSHLSSLSPPTLPHTHIIPFSSTHTSPLWQRAHTRCIIHVFCGIAKKDDVSVYFKRFFLLHITTPTGSLRPSSCNHLLHLHSVVWQMLFFGALYSLVWQTSCGESYFRCIWNCRRSPSLAVFVLSKQWHMIICEWFFLSPRSDDFLWLFFKLMN